MSDVVAALLVIVYLIPIAFFALLLTAESRRPRRLVVGALLTLPVFYTAHFLLLEELQGWPSDEPLPDRFGLLAYRIIEPDPHGNHSGQILIWITTEDRADPRAHRLAYRKELHQALDDAKQRMERGRPQIGARLHRQEPTGVELSETKAGGTTSFSFQDEEPPPLPSKEDN